MHTKFSINTGGIGLRGKYHFFNQPIGLQPRWSTNDNKSILVPHLNSEHYSQLHKINNTEANKSHCSGRAWTKLWAKAARTVIMGPFFLNIFDKSDRVDFSTHTLTPVIVR